MFGKSAAKKPKGVVLVFDDVGEVARIFAIVLRRAGYEAIAVDTIEDAQATLKARKDIDVFVVDVFVDGDRLGLDLAQEAQKRRRKLAVVAMSGYTREEVFPSADERVAFMSKPNSGAQLIAGVEAAMEGVERFISSDELGKVHVYDFAD